MTQLAHQLTTPRVFDAVFGTCGGASEDADRLAALFRRITDAWTGSATGNQRFAEPYQALQEIAQRCEAPNWDNDGALPITRDAIDEAAALLSYLPLSVPIPDIFPEATGSVAFEWYRRPRYRYVLTMSGNRTVEFAGLFGPGNELYGEFRLEGGLPQAVCDHLKHLYS